MQPGDPGESEDIMLYEAIGNCKTKVINADSDSEAIEYVKSHILDFMPDNWLDDFEPVRIHKHKGDILSESEIIADIE